MTISLIGFAAMKAEFEALSAGATRDHALSILEVARWMLESEESGDIKIGRFEVGGRTVILQIEASGEGAERFYYVRDAGGNWYWDVAAQKMDRIRDGLEAGKTIEELKADARIGTIVAALNESEKARAWIEARI